MRTQQVHIEHPGAPGHIFQRLDDRIDNLAIVRHLPILRIDVDVSIEFRPKPRYGQAIRICHEALGLIAGTLHGIGKRRDIAAAFVPLILDAVDVWVG